MLGVAVAPPGARFHGTLPKLGAPVHIADYADGFKICAYAVKGDPAIGTEDHYEWYSWQYDIGVNDYRQLALPDQPRPIYRPENLEAHPDWPVVVFEREWMVDLFHTLSGDTEIIATTVPGGAAQFDMGDWGPLMGREKVVLWPTNTNDCVQAFHELGRKLQRAGARVSLIVIPQDTEKNFSFIHIAFAKWTWPQVEGYMSANRREVAAEVVPIHAARASRGAPPVAEPRLAKQSPVQVRGYRDTWAAIPGLTFAPSGTPYSNAYNVLCTLTHLQYDVWFDEFHYRVMYDTQQPKFWTDAEDVELTCRLQGQFGFAGARTNMVHEALYAYAKRTRRHEVRDWLNTLSWDGTPRLAIMLHRAYGTEATPYFSAVGRCFLMGAVARVLKPGCQVDYVPVFEGKGGSKKTSSLRVLFGKWFDNPSSMMGDKDFLQNMNGKWCLELGELANIHGRAIEIVKSIITRVIDTYRASFGRAPGDYPRQCIFAGTVDRKDWNTDEAGGRRWWPVTCKGDIDLKWLEENREQLFAEAVHRVRAGEEWHNVPVHDAVREQAERRPHDHGWFPLVERYLTGLQETTILAVMCGALEFDKVRDWKSADLKRVIGILKQLGWSERDNGARWVAPTPPPARSP